MRKQILSADNPAIKNGIKLRQKRYRDNTGLYLAEGLNLINEAIENAADLKQVFFRDDFESHEELIRLAENLENRGIYIFTIPDSLFNRLAETETPQGVVGIIEKEKVTEKDFFANPGDNYIVLDRLQDPGNIGTILRTADAAGYGGAIILKGTADIYSGKIVRAAAGSLFRLPVFFMEDPEEVLSILSRHGKKVVCTTPYTDLCYDQIDLAEDVTLIVGNEGNGVCEQFIEGCSYKVKIPMSGTIESLNAAVAASILMYESVRQKRVLDGGIK